MLDIVTKKLQYLGYDVVSSDIAILDMLISKAENYIKHFCNITSINGALKQIAVDMVCGEFLYFLNQTGKLAEFIDTERIVKQVQLGDTSVTFSENGFETAEQKITALIQYLMRGRENELICYRKLSW